MNVDTMRRIDHWAGVPLCAAATLIVRWRDCFRPRAAGPVRRILFVELSEMGTTILADPAMRKARAQLGAELFFVIFKRNAGSLDLLGTFPRDNVFAISDKSLFALARDTLRFLRWCRAKDIDTVVDLELFSRFTALLSGLSGAERRVGFHRFHNEGLYRGAMLTHRVAYNPHIHIAKNFIALVDALSGGIRNDNRAECGLELLGEPELHFGRRGLDVASDRWRSVIEKGVREHGRSERDRASRADSDDDPLH